MIPTFDNGVVRLYQGDVREVLRELPAGSVQTCVTSPPYWGLRDYGLPPLVWGGDKGCEHEWDERSYQRRSNDGGKTEKQLSNAGANSRDELILHAFCDLCGAWRGSLGLEPTIDLYVEHIVEVFREVRRVLRDDGTVWLNMADSYAGSWGAQSRPDGNDIGSTLQGGSMLSARQIEAHPRGTNGAGSLKHTPGLKPKDLCMMPVRVALALQADGWWLRSDIVWSKPNPMPESVTDRPTRSHEYLFLLAKSGTPTYWTFTGRLPRNGSHTKREPFYHWRFRRGGKHNDACTEWCRRGEHRGWKRRNLWEGHDYYYDAEAIREPQVSVHPSGNGYKRGARLSYNGRGQDEQWQPSSVGRNARSVWEIVTEPYREAHFATFPQKLVEPCILAGTPAKGSCSECGAPWERVVERSRSFESGSGHAGNMPAGKNGSNLQGGGETLDIRRGPVVHMKTTGWRPTCGHDAEPEPALVLDPFVGSGTTALVAQRLDRRAIGIDLSAAYLHLAEKRIGLPSRALKMDLSI